MKNKNLNFVLAGYANVGKSVLFNNLTGLHQHIGNWPGKTIEKAEGSLFYKDHMIDVLDLPGIYSLSTYSPEEIITRDYIISAKPDFIANVIDATNLERNLIFTLQLLELERPTIIALNMVNLLKKHGVEIDFEKLQEIMEIPVVPMAAIHGTGVTETIDAGIELIQKDFKPKVFKYGKEVEGKIEQLSLMLQNIDNEGVKHQKCQIPIFKFPKRFIAIKLLEKDTEIENLFRENHPAILEKARTLGEELEKIHGHSSSIVISDERCHLASRVAKQVSTFTEPQKPKLSEKLEHLSSHKIWGYPIMFAILGIVFFTVFEGGDYLSSLLEQATSGFEGYFYSLFGTSIFSHFAWSGITSGIALIDIAFPYILPFYILLFILEDSGYLARVAYLTDRFMHKMGIHGKACIPLILGFGCNVPACLSCRIMETQRERFITALLTAFVPCGALTIVIAGLVGKYLGLQWALGLYLLVFLIIFIIGKIAAYFTPGESTDLIMEMPRYRMPHFKTTMMQTWSKIKEFIYIAGPIVIISGMIIQGAYSAKLLGPLNNLLTPITVSWLGLPAVTGILLILGILRKELILVMLATLVGTTDFISVLTQTQMLILSLVSVLYIPCIATIAVLYKEFGWQKALAITAFKIALAIIVGGLILRLLNLLDFHSF